MRRFIALLLSSIILLTSFAQKKKESNVLSKTPLDSVYKSLKWRNIGPFRGGRANTIFGITGNSQVFYAGYTGGGVWKTENGGVTWKNVSDGFFKVGSIGKITVAESDPNVIYVGSGEHAVRGVMTSYGDGIYKSTDGGKSWKNMGLEKSRHISDIAVHPKDHNVVYVAAQGTVHGPNNERGIYKSVDGGDTWKRVLYINDSTGISSLSMDMNNPRILYAASWEHRRFPWTVSSGGPGSAIWKSTDEGNTWTKLTEGLPASMGKIGISVSRANSNRVYAIVETEKAKSGLYRSDDGGKTWNLLSSNQDLSSRSWYYMKVAADPINENIVYVMNAPIMKSIDGGKTFSNMAIQHGDTHDFWIDPSNNKTVALADDGGAQVSVDQGKSWSSILNQPTAQFYRVNVDNQFPYLVYGGQQDNTSLITASRSNNGELSIKDWTTGPGCESAYLAFDPNDPNLVYGGCYQGYIEVLNRKTNETKDIQTYPTMNLAVQPKDMKYRFNWNAPIIVSPHNPKNIYHAGNVLFKSTNGGLKWDVISPDLTRNEKSKQGPGGIPFTNEGAGGENYNTIFYVAESPIEKGMIWTGSDCGLVYMTNDEGKNWINVTPKDLAECQINSIELSAFDKATAYVSATRYKFNDFGSYTYKTTDFGKTWSKINNGIKNDDFIKVIREDKTNRNILYAGAERGFYISMDAGNSWQPLQLNLPIVPVTDLIIHDNDLVAATAGRAFWILDDIGAIQQHEEKEFSIIKPKTAIRFGAGAGLPEKNPTAGQTAPDGVVIDYFLPAIQDSEIVKLNITDAAGKSVRVFTNKPDPNYNKYPGGPAPDVLLPTEKGHNRFVWDIRTERVKPDVKGVYIFGSYNGYMLAPGKYTAKLEWNNQSVQTELLISKNPNIETSSEEWTEQQQMLSSIHSTIAEIHQQVIDLRRIKKQLNNHIEIYAAKDTSAKLIKAAKSIVSQIDEWEKNIVESRIQNGQDVINWPSKLNAEFFFVKNLMDAADPRVTQGAKDKLKDLNEIWKNEKAKVASILKTTADYNILFKNMSFEGIVL